MKRKAFCLIILLLSIFSCKKDGTTADSKSTQLWINVSNSIPDFDISFNSQVLKSTANNCSVSYINKIFTPNLKSVNITNKDSTKTWVLVHKSSDQTDEIIFKLSDDKILKAKGFKTGEKRFIEVIQTNGGAFSTQDRDIEMINKIIWVD